MKNISGCYCCVLSDCPKSSTCRRFLIGERLSAEYKTMTIYNPTHLRQLPDLDACPYYWDSAPVRHAVGFTALLSQLPGTAAGTLRHALIGRYGRKNYYRYRNGSLPLPPDEQSHILSLVLELTGAAPPCSFDAFEEL